MISDSTRTGADVDLPPGLDGESAQWVRQLGGTPAVRDEAVRRLHSLLLTAARWQVRRLRGTAPLLGPDQLDLLAREAADDATIAVLARLDSYAGRSRFTTWAYKFVILTVSVGVRRAAWRQREIPADPSDWPYVMDPAPRPDQLAETADLAAALRAAISRLTPHERDVLVALAVNDVPIDVLADRLVSNRGAVYKTLHDARARLRRDLREQGFDPPPPRGRPTR